MTEGKQLAPVELEYTDEEFAAIEQAAKDDGLSVDEWMRRITAEFVRERRAAQ